MGLQANELDRLCREEKPIWVKNIKRPAMNILVEIRDPAGEPETIKLVASKHPVCLSDNYPPDMLKACKNLRKLISNGHIELMDPEQMKGAKSAPLPRSLLDVRKKDRTAGDEKPQKGAQIIELATDSDDVLDASIKVSVMCEEVKNKSINPADMIERLGGEDLDEKDLQYIINEMKSFPKIIEFATTELAALREKNGTSSDGDDEDEPDTTQLEESGEETTVQETAEMLQAGNDEDKAARKARIIEDIAKTGTGMQKPKFKTPMRRT
jgi:hypothetical protein